LPAGRAKVVRGAIECVLTFGGSALLRIRRELTLADTKDVMHQPELAEPEDDQPVDVDLVPGVREISVARKAVLVVVQAFAEGEERRHQLVGGAVAGLEAAV